MLKYIKKTVTRNTGKEEFIIGRIDGEFRYDAEALKDFKEQLENELRWAKDRRKKYKSKGNRIERFFYATRNERQIKDYDRQIKLIKSLEEYMAAKAAGKNASRNMFSEEYFKKPERKVVWATRIDDEPSSAKTADADITFCSGIRRMVEFIRGLVCKNMRENYLEIMGLVSGMDSAPINKEFLMRVWRQKRGGFELNIKTLSEEMVKLKEEIFAIIGKLEPEDEKIQSFVDELMSQNETETAIISKYYEDNNKGLDAERIRARYIETAKLVKANIRYRKLCLNALLKDSLSSELSEKLETAHFLLRDLENNLLELMDYDDRMAFDEEIVLLELEWKVEKYNEEVARVQQSDKLIAQIDRRITRDKTSYTRKYRLSAVA